MSSGLTITTSTQKDPDWSWGEGDSDAEALVKLFESAQSKKTANVNRAIQQATSLPKLRKELGDPRSTWLRSTARSASTGT
eukprot:6661431-Pyramimonas_sp.AAC.1